VSKNVLTAASAWLAPTAGQIPIVNVTTTSANP
jgi:hypothetical protein